jgi:hypothetical protein
LLACAGPDEGDSLEATDTVDEPRIATENPNGSPAEIIARRYLVDPDVTAVSYAATGIVGGCSATLIGPNLVLTAAHCGFKSHLSASRPIASAIRCGPSGRRCSAIRCTRRSPTRTCC